MLAALLTLLLVAPALAGDPPAATIRVLVQNVYGRREKDCESRYKALAERILAASPAYDVVALQEHWRVPYDRWFSCDADVLTKALEKDGRYAGAGRSIRHLPRAGEALEVSGGNSIFTRHSIVDSYENKFVNGRQVPLSGFALARVEVAPGVQVDVWNVHLEAGSDGCDDDCRWEQATDFGSVVEMYRDKPVLIVGDFNTGGPMTASEKPPFAGNGGYHNVVGDALRAPRDLWLELGTGDGFTYDCVNNPTQKCKYRERIDYAFVPEHKDMLDPASEHVLVPVKLEVVRWKTDAGLDVSDHYGLDVTLEVRARPKPAASVIGANLAGLEAPRWD